MVGTARKRIHSLMSMSRLPPPNPLRVRAGTMRLPAALAAGQQQPTGRLGWHCHAAALGNAAFAKPQCTQSGSSSSYSQCPLGSLCSISLECLFYLFCSSVT